jgi:hypothetical protein
VIVIINKKENISWRREKIATITRLTKIRLKRLGKVKGLVPSLDQRAADWMVQQHPNFIVSGTADKESKTTI